MNDRNDATGVTEIIDELRRYEQRRTSVDTVFEQWSFAITAVLLGVKIALTVTHAVNPFRLGVPAILALGAAIVGAAVIGQLPTLVRLARQAVSPGRKDTTRDAELDGKLQLLESLGAWPPEALAKARFLVASQGSMTASRLDFLVGPISRLGIVPAIVMLLTSFERLGPSLIHGSTVTLDAVHYATVLTFVLYFAAAVADSQNRRVRFYEDVLEQACNK